MPSPDDLPLNIVVADRSSKNERNTKKKGKKDAYKMIFLVRSLSASIEQSIDKSDTMKVLNNIVIGWWLLIMICQSVSQSSL